MSNADLPDRFADVSDSAASETNRNTRDISAGGGMAISQGDAGTTIAVAAAKRIALWQLTGPFERRVVDGQTENVPSAEAVPVWGLVDPTTGRQEYAYAGHVGVGARLYHVNAIPGDLRSAVEVLGAEEAGAIGVPRYTLGDWVHAQWNGQTGRWEILGSAEQVWRFELLDSLWPNADRDVPSTARARLIVYDAPSARYAATSVIFQVADFYNIHMADAGTRGYARRLADSEQLVGWEVLSLQPLPGQFDGSSYWASSSSSASANPWCSLVPDSASYHCLRFNNVLDAQCDECYKWEDVVCLTSYADCVFVSGCLPEDWMPGGCDRHPCDPKTPVSSVKLELVPSGGQHEVRITIQDLQGVLAKFAKTVDLASQDPFDLTGIPCIENTDLNCNWKNATCDIIS